MTSDRLVVRARAGGVDEGDGVYVVMNSINSDVNENATNREIIIIT